MNHNEIKHWLLWNRVPGVGPTRFYKLLEEFGNMTEAWKASPETLKPLLGEKAFAGWREVRENWDADAEMEKIDHHRYRVYLFSEPDYPPLLKQIADPPPVLYCRGGFEYGDDIAVAIVGTRKPTPLGAFTANELAVELSRQGLMIVSGMARGIDSAAHQGALDAGGRTTAVLGCGLDVVYPRENEGLMEQIAANGAVVTEFPLGTQPLALNFPARNRIISGLSLGVVVVEATNDSGSLITAGFSLEQGREVFAVPGSIGNEGSKGPHKLIRQGAKLVENYRDILNELAVPPPVAAAINDISVEMLNCQEKMVFSVLTREPLHVDQIIRRSGLASAQVNSGLMQLELRGLVKCFPGQLYMRIK